MKKIQDTIDKKFLYLTITLLLAGLVVLVSASFGLFVRNGSSLQDLLFNQIVLGLILGTVVLVAMLKIPLEKIRKYALHIFVVSLVLTLLVFVPHIGFDQIKGAHRWLALGPISFQPSEVLKLGTVIYFAALLPLLKSKMGQMKSVIAIAFGILLLPGIILLTEPDTGTLAVLFAAIIAMLLAAGMRIRHFAILILLSVVCIAGLSMVKPYVKERVLTFLDPSRDPQGAGYQIQKSLLAIGSGEITGRGFGQSIQKFSSFPGATEDSVFAIAGEEFGFIGSMVLVILFLLFGIRGLQIARRAPDMFSGLLAVGIAILIVSQSFANIAAMLGLIPLTGVPLVFVSHGGSALLFALLEVGLLLNISKLKS